MSSTLFFLIFFINLFSDMILFLKLLTKNGIFLFFAKLRTFAFLLFVTTRIILIGLNFFFENLTKFFKLLPLPEINTAVFI